MEGVFSRREKPEEATNAEEKTAIILVTGFPGMDAPHYALKNLGLPKRTVIMHASATDSSLMARDFLRANYKIGRISNSFHDIPTNALPEETDIYIAGPPCQPNSTAGKRKYDKDPRHRLYDDTINRVVAIKPKIAIL